MKKIILTLAFLVIIIGGLFIGSIFIGKAQEVRVSKIEITNVYRNCTLTGNGNFRDTTLQTTVDVSAQKIGKYNLKVDEDKIILKIGPNNAENFSIHKIPTETPYVDGINGSGLHMITGGELIGNQSDTLTICYEGKCDVETIEKCSSM
jgi:hypothetical protein